jgi:hypothetical protein
MAQANSAEQLNALRDGVYQFRLLLEVFIKQEMKLVESRASDLPVRLLVQVANSDRISQQLVEAFGYLQAYGFFQLERKVMADAAVCLYFGSGLVKAWLGVHGVIVCLLHN